MSFSPQPECFFPQKKTTNLPVPTGDNQSISVVFFTGVTISRKYHSTSPIQEQKTEVWPEHVIFDLKVGGQASRKTYRENLPPRRC